MPALLDYVQHRFRSHVFFEFSDLGSDTQPVGDRIQENTRATGEGSRRFARLSGEN
jgi:hypothetical protein